MASHLVKILLLVIIIQEMDNVNKISSIISILVLPFTVSVVIPLVILIFTYNRFFWHLSFPLILLPVIFGFILIVPGIYLLIITIHLFHNIGKGTLAPWNPPKKLVVAGPYKYIRNPMIGSVLLILIGETLITGSLILFSWFIIFFVVNTVYFIYSEEPELIKRFGNNYKKYKETVPMFIPKFVIKKSKINNN
jgi:protein-S-isoprenylcysteine O-methyltransferase Ste14